MEAMLWLSGEHLWPYWDGMGVQVWEMPRGLGATGHKVGFTTDRGLGGHKVCVLPHGYGGLADLKA